VKGLNDFGISSVKAAAACCRGEGPPSDTSQSVRPDAAVASCEVVSFSLRSPPVCMSPRRRIAAWKQPWHSPAERLQQRLGDKAEPGVRNRNGE
jgi:hypothetical protein